MELFTEKEWAELAEKHPDFYGIWEANPYNLSRVKAGELPIQILGKRNRLVWDEKCGTALETEGMHFYIGDVLPMQLPNEEYVYHRENGKTVTVCTMRQQVLHAIGMQDARQQPYTRHGRKFYRPWRNFFSTSVFDPTWVRLVAAGYADHGAIENWCTTYHLTDAGLKWLSEELGICIHLPKKET